MPPPLPLEIPRDTCLDSRLGCREWGDGLRPGLALPALFSEFNLRQLIERPLAGETEGPCPNAPLLRRGLGNPTRATHSLVLARPRPLL